MPNIPIAMRITTTSSLPLTTSFSYELQDLLYPDQKCNV